MFKKNQRPLEALLRLPVEWWSASVCFSAAFALLLAQEYVGLLPPMNSIGAFLLSMLGIKRFFEGFNVVQYQYHLRALKPKPAAEKRTC